MTGIIEVTKALDSDLLANGIVDSGETDLTVGMAKQTLQLVHLVVRDSSKGADLVTPVNKETPYEGELDELAALHLGDMEEDILGNNNTLDLLALLAGSVLVELDLFLRSNKGIIPELQQAVTGGLLAIGRNTRNEPLSLGFGVAGDARGVASDCHWRRNGRGDNFLRHRCGVVTFFAKVGKKCGIKKLFI